jgi:hypothetical protein
MKNLIKIGSDNFYYAYESFVREQYITTDRKFMITRDNGFNYIMVYYLDENNKKQLLSDLYHKGMPSAYPIYIFEDAFKKIKELNFEPINLFTI